MFKPAKCVPWIYPILLRRKTEFLFYNLPKDKQKAFKWNNKTERRYRWNKLKRKTFPIFPSSLFCFPLRSRRFFFFFNFFHKKTTHKIKNFDCYIYLLIENLDKMFVYHYFFSIFSPYNIIIIFLLLFPFPLFFLCIHFGKEICKQF